MGIPFVSPRCRDAAPGIGFAPSRRPMARPRSSSDPPSSTILVADADRDAGRLLAEYLARQGYPAVHTSSGEDVLSLARVGRLGLAIVDVALSDMSGHVLASRLREFDSAIPILMISGDYRDQIEIEARKAGILYYAHKPTDPHTLEAVVAKALAGRAGDGRDAPPHPID